MNISVLIPAAGKGERFGGGKLLSQFNGRPLLHCPLQAATHFGAETIVLVVGNDATAVAEAANEFSPRVVTNPDYADGLGSSISKGAARLDGDAVIVLMADQPFVSAEHLEELASSWDGKPDSIVAASYDEITGPPVLFGRACFESLQRLGGDRGARSILGDPRFSVTTVTMPAAATDIDTRADLERAIRQ